MSRTPLRPVFSYRLDERSGAVARDASGNGRAGRLTHGTGRTRAGRDGGAVVFDGRDDSIAVRSRALELRELTAMAWVKPHAPAGRSRPVIATEGAFVLYADDGDGHAAVRAGGATLRCATPVTPGEWTHVAATSDAATMKLYLNGRLCGEQTWPGAQTAPGGRIRIGGRPAADEWFGGTIDGPQLFAQALSPRAIRARM